jgi:hypothetical protein
MAKRDPERTRRLRNTVRYLLEKDGMAKGNQATLARHFHVSRQRVHQIVVEERAKMQIETNRRLPSIEGA